MLSPFKIINEVKPKMAGIRCTSKIKKMVSSFMLESTGLALLALVGLPAVCLEDVPEKEAEEGRMVGKSVRQVNPRANPSMTAKMRKPYMKPPPKLDVLDFQAAEGEADEGDNTPSE